MGTVTLTTEEYEALLRLQSSERESEGSRLADRRRKPTKRRGRTAKGMGAALREANRKARKKNGDFRKGYNQRRVMQMAHKIRRAKK
jgi:hypothetical protein